MIKNEILIPISVGELVDKISILKIKKKKILNKAKQTNIIKELNFLEKIYKSNFTKNKKIKLYEINLLTKSHIVEEKLYKSY